MTEAQASRIIELLTEIRDELKADPDITRGDLDEWGFTDDCITVSYNPMWLRCQSIE